MPLCFKCFASSVAAAGARISPGTAFFVAAEQQAGAAGLSAMGLRISQVQLHGSLILQQKTSVIL